MALVMPDAGIRAGAVTVDRVEVRAPVINLVRIGRLPALSLLWCGVVACAAEGAVLVQEPLADGVIAGVQQGRVLYLDCRLPPGNGAKGFLAPYLADPGDWTDYRDRQRVAIPFHRLNSKTQRAVLLAIFPSDYVDESGWWHTVVFDDARGKETVWALAEWLTGLGTHYRAILEDARNGGIGEELRAGQKVLVPAGLLLPVMAVPTPKPLPEEEVEAAAEAPAEGEGEDAGDDAAEEDDAEGEAVPLGASQLAYGEDGDGAYAVYRLRRGEALFTSVVVRFTDIRENGDIMKACEAIMRRSRIKDDRDIEIGTRIIIPLEMLSDRYQPEGSEARESWEVVQREAERLEGQRVARRDLEGVVVMLDPGHGGCDPGAKHEASRLYEDELVYDLVCRIKAILERDTGARVVMTLEDPDQGFQPSDRTRFTHDEDERLLTTPLYPNRDVSESVSLRWCLANDAYERLVKEGVDERNMLFASIHCDWLYRGQMRGAMVYVPGARYSVVKYPLLTKASYRNYAESKDRRVETPPLSERQRNEALSRNFAQRLLKSMSAHEPALAVHRSSDPIRNVIHNGGKSYVPAVLRYNKVPTRVLVEAANLSNVTDRKRVADPQWREWFAEAFVDAVKRHFDS